MIILTQCSESFFRVDGQYVTPERYRHIVNSTESLLHLYLSPIDPLTIERASICTENMLKAFPGTTIQEPDCITALTAIAHNSWCYQITKCVLKDFCDSIGLVVMDASSKDRAMFSQLAKLGVFSDSISELKRVLSVLQRYHGEQFHPLMHWVAEYIINTIEDNRFEESLEDNKLVILGSPRNNRSVAIYSNGKWALHKLEYKSADKDAKFSKEPISFTLYGLLFAVSEGHLVVHDDLVPTITVDKSSVPWRCTVAYPYNAVSGRKIKIKAVAGCTIDKAEVDANEDFWITQISPIAKVKVSDTAKILPFKFFTLDKQSTTLVL